MKYCATITFLFILTSCAERYYTNDSGAVRPVKKDVFSYKKSFTTFSSLIDTNAVYIRHSQYLYSNGTKDFYEYYKFFGSGQMICSGSDTILDLSKADDLNKGIIGRYYFKDEQLRIQLFYIESISRHISKIYGFVKDGNVYTYRDSPETWYGSYSLTKSFSGKNIQEWKRQSLVFKFSQKPDW